MTDALTLEKEESGWVHMVSNSSTPYGHHLRRTMTIAGCLLGTWLAPVHWNGMCGRDWALWGPK